MDIKDILTRLVYYEHLTYHGRPSPAQFHSAPFSRSHSSYNLSWLIESYPPLEEVRLLFRKVMMNDSYQQPGKWHDVTLQPVNTGTHSHPMSYNIRGLQPSSVYEAIIQAKNHYGWNEVSDLYQFYTRGPDYPSEPSMEDMTLLAAAKSSTWRISPAILIFINILYWLS